MTLQEVMKVATANPHPRYKSNSVRLCRGATRSTLLGILASAAVANCSLAQDMKNPETQSFSVRDYGATGDGQHDDQIAIERTIRAAAAWTGQSVEHAAVVYFPAGTYALTHIYKLYAINLVGSRNISVRGQVCPDAKVYYCVKLIGAPATLNQANGLPVYNSFFNVSQSHNIHISNFYLDKQRPYFSQGKVLAVDPVDRTVDLEFDRGYQDFSDPLTDRLLNTIVVFTDPALRNWDHSDAACLGAVAATATNHDCHNFHMQAKQVLRPGVFRVQLDQAPPQEFVGHSYLMWRNLGWQPGFMVDRSSDVVVENIFYTGGGGPGAHVQASDGEVLFRNFTVDVPAGSGRLFAATSGFNGSRNRGKITLDKVHVAHTDDDAFHFAAGYYYPVIAEAPDKRSISIALCYDGDFRPGDQVAAWDWSTKRYVASATVMSSASILDQDRARYPRACRIALDKPLPLLNNLRSYENSFIGRRPDVNDRILNMSFQPFLTVKDSYLSSMRARCGIIQVSANVSGNTCRNTILAGFLVGPEFVWGEGYAVKDVSITNNDFDSIGGTAIYIADIADSNRSPTYAQMSDPKELDTNNQKDNRNISIQGNRFSNLGAYGHGIMGIRGAAITVENASSVQISGNTVVHSALEHRDAPTSIVVSPSTTSNVSNR